MRMRRRQRGAADLHGAGENGLNGGTGAGKRHVGDINATDDLEQFSRQQSAWCRSPELA